MRRPVILLVFFCFAAVSAVAVYIRLRQNPRRSVTVPVSLPTPPAPPAILKTWDDLNASFSFKYPEGLTVNPHDEDSENYAHLEITDQDYPGGIIIWAKDATASTVQAWFTNDKTISGASILDTTLGGEPAKKAVFPALPKKILTGAVYDGMHVYAELLPGLSEAYWNEVYNTILADFRFTEGHTGSGIRQNQAAGSAASYDEEEVLE